MNSYEEFASISDNKSGKPTPRRSRRQRALTTSFLELKNGNSNFWWSERGEIIGRKQMSFTKNHCTKIKRDRLVDNCFRKGRCHSRTWTVDSDVCFPLHGKTTHQRINEQVLKDISIYTTTQGKFERNTEAPCPMQHVQHYGIPKVRISGNFTSTDKKQIKEDFNQKLTTSVPAAYPLSYSNNDMRKIDVNGDNYRNPFVDSSIIHDENIRHDTKMATNTNNNGYYSMPLTRCTANHTPPNGSGSWNMDFNKKSNRKTSSQFVNSYDTADCCFQQEYYRESSQMNSKHSVHPVSQSLVDEGTFCKASKTQGVCSEGKAEQMQLLPKPKQEKLLDSKKYLSRFKGFLARTNGTAKPEENIRLSARSKTVINCSLANPSLLEPTETQCLSHSEASISTDSPPIFDDKKSYLRKAKSTRNLSLRRNEGVVKQKKGRRGNAYAEDPILQKQFEAFLPKCRIQPSYSCNRKTDLLLREHAVERELKVDTETQQLSSTTNNSDTKTSHFLPETRDSGARNLKRHTLHRRKAICFELQKELRGQDFQQRLKQVYSKSLTMHDQS